MGLQIYYPFFSSSVNGNLVANLATGSPVFDATLMNGAMVSNNQLHVSRNLNQYVRIEDITFGNNGITFATWFNVDSFISYTPIFLFQEETPTANGYMVLFAAYSAGSYNMLFQVGYLGAVSSSVGAASIAQNVWYHVAVVLDPTGQLSIFVNGQLDFQSSGTYPRQFVAITTSWELILFAISMDPSESSVPTVAVCRLRKYNSSSLQLR